MAKTFVFFLALAVFNIACGMPALDDEEDDSSSPPGLSRRDCSCSKHHHQCGCCLHIKAHPFHTHIDANICMNATYVPSPLGVEFMLTWNKKVMFNKTISAADPPPICFGLPHLKVDACIKFSNVSVKKGHTGACAALEFKALAFHKFIPLGCFFFRTENGALLDMETFLDTESLVSLLEDFSEQPFEGEPFVDTAADSLVYLPNKEEQMLANDDVTELLTVDGAGCKCQKSPPQCDCCVQFKVFHFPVKACVHGDVDLAHTGFDVAVIINGLTVFKKHISGENPPPICKSIKIFHISVKVCLKFTKVSVKPGHIGACVELDVGHTKLSLGCFYMADLVTKE